MIRPGALGVRPKQKSLQERESDSQKLDQARGILKPKEWNFIDCLRSKSGKEKRDEIKA